MTWYRKYRPKTIKNLHLKSVRETFLSLMDQGKFPQVMLFAGPKGTGKTSTSRIIGAMLNEPKNSELVDYIFLKKEKPKKNKFYDPDITSSFAQKVYEGHSYVVQEMDAASNRGIDDVRSLKERVMLPPQEGKISVYILDEAHMLTTEAFNALLKLLEEPPAHVVFILATTELHKIPPTIVSRCTTVAFRKAIESEVYQSVEQILKAEKIKFDPDALSIIARRADGSFRDAVKMLELVTQTGDVTTKTVNNLLGGDHISEIKELITAVLDKKSDSVSEIFQNLRSKNTDQKFFHKALFEFLHKTLLESLGVIEGKPFTKQVVAHFLLTELLSIKVNQPSPIVFLPLELKLLEIINRAKGKGNKNSGTSKPPSSSNSSKNNLKTNTKVKIKDEKPSQSLSDIDSDLDFDAPQDEENYQTNDSSEEVIEDIIAVAPTIKTDVVKTDVVESALASDEETKDLINRWEEFLNVVSAKNPTVAALLRSSKPIGGANGLAKIGVFYNFHKEQLQQTKFSTIIENCGIEMIGSTVKFDYLLQNIPKKAELKDINNKSEALTSLVEETLM